MEYQAGDVVEFRNGQRAALEEYPDGTFPLCFRDHDGCFGVPLNGKWYSDGEESALDIVKLIHRPQLDGREKTLRDEFAMRILQGWCANNVVFFNGPRTTNEASVELAKMAYTIADEMMKARELRND